MSQEILKEFSKEQLCDLVTMMAKNWLALDGVWFQSIERKFGMDEAMYHDGQAWDSAIRGLRRAASNNF